MADLLEIGRSIGQLLLIVRASVVDTLSVHRS
jgi:hypothetical protein